MSRNRDRTYSFKRHRDALYAILESAVTGGGGAAADDDDVDVNSSRSSSSRGGPSTAVRGREPANLASSREEQEGCEPEPNKKTYPSDFLWYEEMTPSDIHAYHAAHRDTPPPVSSGGGASTADPPLPLDHRGTPTAATPSRRDHRRHGEHGCSKASGGRGNVAAGGGDVVVAEEGQASPPSPRLLSTPLLVPATHHPSGTERGEHKVSEPELAPQLAVVSSSEMVQTPLIYSSSSSKEWSTAALLCEVPRNRGKEKNPSEQQQSYHPERSIGEVRDTSGNGTATTNNNAEDRFLGEPSKRPRLSPQQVEPPVGRAGGQEEQAGRGGAAVAAAAAATATSPAAAAAEAAVAAIPLSITDSQVRHVVGRRWSEAREKTRLTTTTTTTTTTVTTAAAMTLSASEQSQATQSMFLPGLPSQLLVTQQQQGGGGWDRIADEDHQQQEEWEETAASEYALSLPAPHDESIDDAPTGSVAAELAPDPGRVFDAVHASFRGGAGSTELAPGGNGGGNHVSEKVGRETRARQNESFTRVLRKFAGSARERSGVATGPSVGSARGGDGRGERAKKRLILVPTQEVLPSGWSAGQAGVVGILEDHLLRARERFSDGYTVRALELACQVFRQPSVCVRTGSSGEDDIGGTRRGSVVARQVDPSGDVLCVPSGDHAEVVGVVGLVWEILHQGSSNQRCAGLS